jgi:hypothetical protein
MVQVSSILSIPLLGSETLLGSGSRLIPVHLLLLLVLVVQIDVEVQVHVHVDKTVLHGLVHSLHWVHHEVVVLVISVVSLLVVLSTLTLSFVISIVVVLQFDLGRGVEIENSLELLDDLGSEIVFVDIIDDGFDMVKNGLDLWAISVSQKSGLDNVVSILVAQHLLELFLVFQ